MTTHAAPSVLHKTAVSLCATVFLVALHSALQLAPPQTEPPFLERHPTQFFCTSHRWPTPGSGRPSPTSLQLRGGNSDAEMKTRLEILDEWDMVTQEDELGMNVTMLQSRIWPYCIIELWWESLGKFRFTYDEPAEDIMCAFPQGSTSNMSGWDNEELFKTIRQSRGMAALPDLPLEMGSWRLNVNGTILLITNKAQPENHLFVTDRGFYFLDKVGYALKTEGATSSHAPVCSPSGGTYHPFFAAHHSKAITPAICCSMSHSASLRRQSPSHQSAGGRRVRRAWAPPRGPEDTASRGGLRAASQRHPRSRLFLRCCSSIPSSSPLAPSLLPSPCSLGPAPPGTCARCRHSNRTTAHAHAVLMLLACTALCVTLQVLQHPQAGLSRSRL